MRRLLSRGGRKRGSQRGSIIIEASVALALIVIVAIFVLRTSLNATFAMRWTVIQAMTDAYMTNETAMAKRVPFADLVADTSPWPLHPTVNTQTDFEIGRLPGGVPLTVTLRRFRTDSTTTSEVAGANQTDTEIVVLETSITYELGHNASTGQANTYTKSRTVLRSR